MKLVVLAGLTAVALVSRVGLAQGPGDIPPLPPPPPSPAAPPPESAPSCSLSEHAGFEEPDARTAAMLVCSAIAHAGPAYQARYRVSLGKLGSTVILSVAEEGATPGSTVDSREMRLQGIEEVEVAAPRIAAALVHHIPVTDTETVDNLVGGETRKPQGRSGKVHFALGLVGVEPPLDQGFAPAPGIILDVHYETPDLRLELGGSFRAGGGSASNTSPQEAFAIFSVGARYYTSDADVSPYLGAGLSWEFLSLTLPYDFTGNNSGLGAYIDAGVEILRTHHAHLALGVRLDVPFFALNSSIGDAGSVSPNTPLPSSYYYAPLSLEMRLTF
jgi:hypothetical protein